MTGQNGKPIIKLAIAVLFTAIAWLLLSLILSLILADEEDNPDMSELVTGTDIERNYTGVT